MECIRKVTELRERGFKLWSFDDLVPLLICPGVIRSKIEAMLGQMVSERLDVHATIASLFSIQWQLFVASQPHEVDLAEANDQTLLVFFGQGTVTRGETALQHRAGDRLFVPAGEKKN